MHVLYVYADIYISAYVVPIFFKVNNITRQNYIFISYIIYHFNSINTNKIYTINFNN